MRYFYIIVAAELLKLGSDFHDQDISYVPGGFATSVPLERTQE